MFAMILRCVFAGMLLHAGSVFAAETARNGHFPVQAAVLFEHGEPVAGATMCSVGQECRIFTKENHGIQLSLRTSKRHDRCFVQELSLDCADAQCSFDNERSNLAFSDRQQFDFFEGVDHALETHLVLRTRAKIGRILLIIPPLGQTCLAPDSR